MSERELVTISTSQVARSNVEVLDTNIDGAGLSLKVDSFEPVLHVAANFEGLLFNVFMWAGKSVLSYVFTTNYFKNRCGFSLPK